jgi:hypothetical protein
MINYVTMAKLIYPQVKTLVRMSKSPDADCWVSCKFKGLIANWPIKVSISIGSTLLLTFILISLLPENVYIGTSNLWKNNFRGLLPLSPTRSSAPGPLPACSLRSGPPEVSPGCEPALKFYILQFYESIVLPIIFIVSTLSQSTVPKNFFILKPIWFFNLSQYTMINTLLV